MSGGLSEQQLLVKKRSKSSKVTESFLMTSFSDVANHVVLIEMSGTLLSCELQ